MNWADLFRGRLDAAAVPSYLLRSMRNIIAILLLVASPACASSADPSAAISNVELGSDVAPDTLTDSPVSASDSASLAPRPVPPPSEVPEPASWVAIGDVHGDLAATRRALSIAGAIDDNDRWIGGELVVIQLGDQLDRGDDEQAILDLLERLADEAHAAGGALYILLGNHETMNVDRDFSYVTPGGWSDFADTPHRQDDPTLAAYPSEQRGRVAAFVPGGPYARVLAGHNVAMKVGDTLFVHGGLMPRHHTLGLASMNESVSAWMRGDGPIPIDLVYADDGPLWDRSYSDAPDAADCTLLEATLAAFGAARLVVAHTVQDDGITSACDARVWRVDVGLARFYGGTTQVLARGPDGRLSVIE